MYEFCNECKYKENYNPISYMAMKNQDIIIVLDRPNKYEKSYLKLTNIDKQLILNMLNFYNIPLQRVYITTLCKCYTEDEKLKAKSIKACKQLLIDEIKFLKPKLVIGFGEEPTKLLSGKNKAFLFLRGYINYNSDYNFFNINSFSPRNIIKNYTNFVDFEIDFIKISELYQKICNIDNFDKKFIEKIIHPVKNLKYNHIDTLEKFEKYITPLVNKQTYLVLDIETSGLKAGDNTLLKGINDLSKNPYNTDNWEMHIIQENILTNKKTHKILQQVLETNRIITQNGKFDIRFLCEGSNIKLDIETIKNYHDTMVMHSCIDERLGTHSLKTWAKNYFNAHDWEGDIKKYLPNKDSSYSLIPREKLNIYLTYDLWYTSQGFILFNKLIQNEGTAGYYKILMDATNVMTEIEHNGVLVSKQLPIVKKELEELQQKELKKLIKMVYEHGFTPEKYVKITGAKTTLKYGAFNPNSSKQAQYAFYYMLNENGKNLIPLWEDEKEKDENKKYKPSCCKEAVEAYRVKHPLWEQLARYKNYSDVAFIKSLDEKMDYDHRIRTNFNLVVSSGRTSSSKFNLQNSKRGSKVKHLLLPDEGCILVDFDYKTLEVIVSGLISKDEEILNIFRRSQDFHNINTENIFKNQLEFYRNLLENNNIGKLYDSVKNNSMLVQTRNDILTERNLKKCMEIIFKTYRFKSKAVTFGVLYNRGAQSLAKKELNCETVEAQQFIDNFFEKFSTFKKWSDNTQKFAIDNGYVKTWFGHKRRFKFIWDGSIPQIKRQAPNTVIQGTASQICLTSLIRIHNRFKKETENSKILFTVHDSIVSSIQKNELLKGIQIMIDEMSKNPILPELPFMVDGEIGLNYGEKTEFNIIDDKISYKKEEFKKLIEGVKHA
jgi:uracil-DNA glycosylase family 4